MTMMLPLTPQIEKRLKREAEVRGVSAEFFGLNLLIDALEECDEPEETLEELVARIQATPPNPDNIENANGDLLAALSQQELPTSDDPNAWKVEMLQIEAEIQEMREYGKSKTAPNVSVPA